LRDGIGALSGATGPGFLEEDSTSYRVELNFQLFPRVGAFAPTAGLNDGNPFRMPPSPCALSRFAGEGKTSSVAKHFRSGRRLGHFAGWIAGRGEFTGRGIVGAK